MIELEAEWELALAQAQQRARAAGRRDIADYLNLRRRNDLLRRTATDWFINVFVVLAGEANRAGAGIQIEQQDEHVFHRGTATMVGKQITLRSGVRALTIESGWPRTPRHGFVSGDGLACANIKHFGRPRRNEELLLVRSTTGAPKWFVLKKNGRALLTEVDVQRHLALLTAT